MIKRLLPNILAITFMVFLVFIDIDLQASPPGGGGPGGQGGCIPPPCVPIDGGISLLVAAGVAFGGKKLLDNMKS